MADDAGPTLETQLAEAEATIAALRGELRALRARYDQLRADLAANDFERPPHY